MIQNTRLKVGIFTVAGIVLTLASVFLVDSKPFWWKKCQLIQIMLDDATGLKKSSPVRSQGLDIGYLRDVTLQDNKVVLKICLTAPLELSDETRAYIRTEGIMGDKYIELKPVVYHGIQ